MIITRRRFFGLVGGVVAAKLAPPIHILPPAGGWGGHAQSVGYDFAFDSSRSVLTLDGFPEWAAGANEWQGIDRSYVVGYSEVTVEELRAMYPGVADMALSQRLDDAQRVRNAYKERILRAAEMVYTS